MITYAEVLQSLKPFLQENNLTFAVPTQMSTVSASWTTREFLRNLFYSGPYSPDDYDRIDLAPDTYGLTHNAGFRTSGGKFFPVVSCDGRAVQLNQWRVSDKYKHFVQKHYDECMQIFEKALEPFAETDMYLLVYLSDSGRVKMHTGWSKRESLFVSDLMLPLMLEKVPFKEGAFPEGKDKRKALLLHYAEAEVDHSVLDDYIVTFSSPVTEQGYYDFSEVLEQIPYGDILLENYYNDTFGFDDNSNLGSIPFASEKMPESLNMTLENMDVKYLYSHTYMSLGDALRDTYEEECDDEGSYTSLFYYGDYTVGYDWYGTWAQAAEILREDLDFEYDGEQLFAYSRGSHYLGNEDAIEQVKSRAVSNNGLIYPELLNYGTITKNHRGNPRFISHNRLYDTFFPVESWCYDPNDEDGFRFMQADGTSLSGHEVWNQSEPPLYLGVELEMDKGGEAHDKADVIVGTLTRGRGIAYAMHDGSLANGIEIATHPAVLEAHMNPEVFDYEAAFKVATIIGYRGHNTTTAGLHVHMNRRFFGDTGLEQDYRAALMALIIENNWDALVEFARRDYSRVQQWASKKNMKERAENAMKRREPGLPDKGIIARAYKYEYEDDKYVALNCGHSNTYELRIFKSTLRYETYIATLQFVSNLAHIVKELDYEKACKTTFDDVVTYKNYEELSRYIMTRGLYQGGE